MLDTNAESILNCISPVDKVLDIGGWARPFNRANYVLDAEPYETRGYGGRNGPPQGGAKEFFSKETWIKRDICEKTPYPFNDKEIDFVICSHTLEDVRDPLWVCSEMIRIAKRGYIEVPSRIAESSRGIEQGQVGWSHHRWLVEIEENSIRFLMKYHMIHSHWKYSLPANFLRSLEESQKVQWLFWVGLFQFSEQTIHGVENIARELECYVQRTRPYPEFLLKADRSVRLLTNLPGRILRRFRRQNLDLDCNRS